MKKKANPEIDCQYFSWTITLRDGVYQANRRGNSHQRRRHSLGTRDWNEAQVNLEKLDLYVAEKEGLITPQERASHGQNPSIEAGWRLYLEHCDRPQVEGGVSPNTLKRYRAVRDHHLDFCRRHGIDGWAGFDKAQASKLGKERESRAAYRTIYLELTTLKGVNRWLIEEKLLPETCRLRIRLQKPQGTSTYCYTTGEVQAMLAHCRHHEDLLWLHDVILALSHTGMRIGELVALRWEDIDLQSEFLYVVDERAVRHRHKMRDARTTKGKRSRAIPIHSRLKEVLEQMPRSDDGFVFHTKRGKRVSAKLVCDTLVQKVIHPLKPRFPSAKSEIGFADGRVHSFRHFFCSQCFIKGAGEGEIREWLGHAESKMVEHYRHLGADEAKRRMNSINFLGEDSGSSSS